jgi:alpha-L-fucosidase
MLQSPGVHAALVVITSGGICATGACEVETPAPVGALPTDAQVAWHALEFYGFIHFTTNTFTDKEWGYGDESPQIFNPTALDCGQWVRIAREAGMRGLILTAKHHDGFCLWPSALTEHSVRASPWRDGKGDVVRELAEACAAGGLQFGVYLSPWDRNHADYGGPDYVAYYREQLRELLTGYGPVFEVWHDGANGGDGYYGGANETRHIDKTQYYGWPETWRLVSTLMPDAIVFSDVGPGCRWVGNERGFSAETSWQTIEVDGQMPGMSIAKLDEGDPAGSRWIGVEADVSIRPGWFYHESENDRVKSGVELVEIWYGSVGRGANLLLNVPPDRRGLIHEADEASLREMRRVLAETFDENVANGAQARASHERGDARRFGASNLLDGDTETYWATDDGVTSADVVFELGREQTFDVVKVCEAIRLGQRVESFAVDWWDGQTWQELARGTTVGPRRVMRTARVTTERVRLRIESCRGTAVVVSEFGIYLRP